MHTTIGTVTLSASRNTKIQIVSYPGSEARNLGLAMPSENKSIDDFVAFFSPTGRLIFRTSTDKDGYRRDRQWIVPADVEIGKLDTVAVAYKTEDDNILVLDLSNVDKDYVAVMADSCICIIDVKGGKIIARFCSASEYDLFLCEHEEIDYLPIPIWENGNYGYRQEDWIKPSIQTAQSTQNLSN